MKDLSATDFASKFEPEIKGGYFRNSVQENDGSPNYICKNIPWAILEYYL